MTVIFLFIFALAIFATVAIYFANREEKAQKVLLIRERELNRKLYEISILKEIAERIGYSLDVSKIVDIITGSLRNLFPYSTASSLLVSGEELSFKTYVEEGVSHTFIGDVKKRMLSSFEVLSDEPLPQKINESLAGVVLDDGNKNPLASFFNIPLVINNKIVGLINVSSQKPGLYKEEEMTILYRITNQASLAVSSLETVLETEKGKLMSMISSLADGVFMIDKDTRLVVINPRALSMLRITQREPSIFDIIDSLTGKLDLRTKIEEAIKTDKLVAIPELKLLENLFVQVLITPVVDKEGQVFGAAVLLHDITAEKTVAQMKEEFTNMMVHELRAPLTTIKQAASLLLESREALEKAKQENFLRMIRDSSENLLTEVSDLLDAAKLEAGRLTIAPLPQDLAQTINERIEAFKTWAKEKNINLTTQISPNLPRFPFDKTRVAQALNNLLSNALKFTPAGGSIRVAAREEDEGIKVSITDTGMGIPKEKQDRLFSKFSQVHPAPSGAGLGLYITRGIIEAHGGKIDLTSEVGRGTTVTFSLPEKPPLLN